MKANAENQPHVTCILDRGTALYVGAREGLYQASGGRLHRMDLGPEIAGAAVTAGCRDISGAVWLGFWNGAVICLDGSEQRFLELREPIPGAGRISDLVVDAAGHVWLASASAGIVARCRKQEDLLAIDSHAVLTQTWVGAMVRAPDGTLWLGAGRGAHWRGVASLDGCRVVPHLGLPEGVVVRSLVPLASGEFWVGTQDGLFLLSPGRAVRYGGEHGLPCTIITALLLDRDGTLWIGTEGGGVCRHDGSVFQTIGLPPGSAFAVIRCLHEDASGGRVWLGTDGGLIEYTRRTQQPSVAVEPLVGEGVGTDGEVARVSSSVGRVVFRLRGAGSGLLDRLVYRYRLFGHDREWQQTRDTCVEYADLQPGSYEFAVQAVDSDLNYSRMAGVKLAVSADAWHALLVTAQVQRLRELPERRGRIVLVDEDRAYGVALRRLLARIGHELEVLPSVDAAREHLRHGSCDLVLLRAACQAPRLVQDIWALRGHGADCDVVVLGAHDSIGAAQQCARLGPAAVLPRTAAPQELVRAVERVLLVRWDPVATYLRRHLDTVGGRADLARRCHVSPGTILNHFTRCAGVSYSQFEQRVRMERAMGLLVHSHLDIKQVASRVGMSPAAFARAFRRVAGCTPLHFRRMARIPLSQ